MEVAEKRNEIIRKLREFVDNNFLYNSDVEAIKDDDSFISNGIIDSTGVLELIDYIEETFGFSIENNEVTPENLDSFSNIAEFILRKTK